MPTLSHWDKVVIIEHGFRKFGEPGGSAIDRFAIIIPIGNRIFVLFYRVFLVVVVSCKSIVTVGQSNMSLSQVSPSILSAARITVAFLALYGMTVANTAFCKIRHTLKAKSEGKVFNRYSSTEMLNVDRLAGNF